MRPSLRTSPKGLSIFFTAMLPGIFLFGGCSKAPEEDVVVAKVQDQVLTLGELRESFPVQYEEFVSRDQYLDFIKRWIDNEVLYQEANKREIHSRPEVVRKIERMRRKIIIEEFLASDLFLSGLEPDEAAMSQFYELNKEGFQPQGSNTPLAFEDVHEEIRNRIIAARRRKLMEDKIQEFKGGLAIDYALDKVPGISEISNTDSLSGTVDTVLETPQDETQSAASTPALSRPSRPSINSSSAPAHLPSPPPPIPKAKKSPVKAPSAPTPKGTDHKGEAVSPTLPSTQPSTPNTAPQPHQPAHAAPSTPTAAPSEEKTSPITPAESGQEN